MKYIKKLEIHKTTNINTQKINGELTVVYRDWDKQIKTPISMIYITSVNPNEVKGPHLHKKRNSYFLCIKGKLLFIIKNKNGSYKEIIVESSKPQMIFVPKGYSSAHLNLSKTISSILVLADLAWRPNDNEMENVEFTDYNWKKWKRSRNKM